MRGRGACRERRPLPGAQAELSRRSRGSSPAGTPRASPPCRGPRVALTGPHGGDGALLANDVLLQPLLQGKAAPLLSLALALLLLVLREESAPWVLGSCSPQSGSGALAPDPSYHASPHPLTLGAHRSGYWLPC